MNLNVIYSWLPSCDCTIITADAQVPAQKPTLTLPSTVFASEGETSVGLLNKAVAIKGMDVV